MDDLISRQAVFDELKGLYIAPPKITNDMVWDSAIDTATDKVKDLPSIDAVEVVRCRDCKHWVKDGNDSYGYAMFCKANCSLGGQGIKKPNDFCSYGERKTDG